jgi:hypothetical protein
VFYDSNNDQADVSPVADGQQTLSQPSCGDVHVTGRTSKALVSVIPFVNARESIMLLFTPFLKGTVATEFKDVKFSQLKVDFVDASGILFTRGSETSWCFSPAMNR